MIRKLKKDDDNQFILDNDQSNEQNNNSNSPNLNVFPVPFQYLERQRKENLDKKFNETNKQSNQSISKSNSDNDDCYLIDACHLICQAQNSEERQEYESAFESYKCAISILLKGVKHEKDRTKKLNVRKKVEKYLSKAEAIYDKHLIKEERSGRKFSLDTPYKQMMNDELCTDKNALSKFKLLSISNKVQIVYDLQLNEKFAIKVVRKVPNLNNLERYFIFPKQIPNMAQLYQIYENDYAYFLILEFFNCSKLSDILDQIRQSLSPCVECLFDDPIEQLSVSDEAICAKDSNGFDEDLEDILFDKEKFNDEDEFCLNRSDSVKTLNEIEDDLLNYQASSRLVSSKSEQKLSSIVHSKSVDFKNFSTSLKSNQCPNSRSINSTNSNSTKSTFNTLTGIFDRARNLIQNVDRTIRNTSIDQARLSIDNINLQCNLNNFILERINDKLSSVYICDRHLNKQLNDYEIEGKMLFTEKMVKKWLYQILVALEHLHDQGIIYVHLNPTKVLISEDLQDVSLAYKCSLDYKLIAMTENLDPLNISQLIRSSFYSTYSSSTYSYYIAPELFFCGFEISSAVDWYSFGCLTYELLTNKPLSSLIPSIDCKNLIQFPSYISLEARDLIDKLLQINPNERLNSADAIKSHVFFRPL